MLSVQSIGLIAQVILLEEAWSELFLLNAVQWCLPLESSPLFSAAELTALTLSPHSHPHSGMHLQTTTGKPSQVAADVRHLHDTLQRYKAVMVDPAEFACMKAIVLFRPGRRLRPPRVSCLVNFVPTFADGNSFQLSFEMYLEF